jgi:hypothetical protein
VDFNFDDNILWILGILALVFFLFPQKSVKTVPEKAEEKEEYEYIYRRKGKERRKLVY